ncbi:MAG: aminoglycoside phosphotransferase family protein [Bacteroidetes bacterium]|nr:aminoglycoside phosphotransferase family protein [Bacteroidota bacterium]
MEKTEFIVRQFRLPEVPVSIAPLGEGFINDTYIVNTQSALKYVLQRKNHHIFQNIPGLVNNICKVTDHIRNKATSAGRDPERSTIRLYPAHDGKFYYVDDEESYWVCMYYIPDTRCFDTASTPALAYAGGVGIGFFQEQLADFTEELAEVLPGFHDIRYRFAQWDAALKSDRAGRKKELGREIEWVDQHRQEMLDFKMLLENKTIPPRISHNDTKISNILFDRDGSVLCAIDLDTLMKSSVLYDFGDAIRSYTNTAAEDEAKTEKVSMEPTFFREYTRGYLSYAHRFLTDPEVQWLAFAPQYITYEQVLRFLMDYIDGDTYYKIRYPTHNLVRTHAQYALFQSMERAYPTMQATVSEIYLPLRP